MITDILLLITNYLNDTDSVNIINICSRCVLKKYKSKEYYTIDTVKKKEFIITKIKYEKIEIF